MTEIEQLQQQLAGANAKIEEYRLREFACYQALGYSQPTNDALPHLIELMKHDMEAYRGALGYSAPGDHDGKLTDGTTPQCGICNSEHRRTLEAQLEASQGLVARLQDSLAAVERAVEFDAHTEPLSTWVQRIAREHAEARAVLDAAHNACAEMRHQIIAIKDAIEHNQPIPWLTMFKRMEHALSTDCGKGWHSPAEWDALQARCGEMRSTLKQCWRESRKDPRVEFLNRRIDHALSQDAGKDFVPKTELEHATKERDEARTWVEKFKSEAWVSDAEIALFQDRVRHLLLNLTKCPDAMIDGKGSDSGWEDFTLAEIGQGVAYVIDQRDAAQKACAQKDSALHSFLCWEKCGNGNISEIVAQAKHALSSDCGKDWHSPQEWEERQRLYGIADAAHRELEAEYRAELDKLKEVNKSLAEALSLLMDWQNGPPLPFVPKWETGWGNAMQKSREALDRAKENGLMP